MAASASSIRWGSVMIFIRTYLRANNGNFVAVEECVLPPRDSDYIEGAIELKLRGTEIIGKREWDYVDQLWCYIAEMIAKLGVEDRVDTYFPDQPICLIFERKGTRLLVSSDVGGSVRRADVNEHEFLTAVRLVARVFFAKMSQLIPSNSEAYDLALSQLAE
jgi:hypothetical protein